MSERDMQSLQNSGTWEFISPQRTINVALKPESILFQPKQTAVANSSFHFYCELGAA